MKHICRSVCFILTFVLILSMIPFVGASAEGVEITYTYANAIAGDGEGVITVSELSGSGYFSLYFADDTAVLDGYEPIAVVRKSGATGSVTLPRAFFIPPQATQIAVYEHKLKTPTDLDLDLSAALGLYEIPAEKKLSAETPSLTFASVSDAHLNYDDNGYGASAKWTAALNFFDEMGIDYVILSGDMTSSGGTTDYERYAAATAASSFPVDHIYEAQGNHDATQVARFLSYTSGPGEKHPFDGCAWFSVYMPGQNGARANLFIFMAQELSGTSGTPTTDNFSTRQLDWVEGLLRNYAGTETNIYIVEHAMIHNFGPGDKYDGVYVEPMYFQNKYPGNIRFKSLLTEYKEAILMTGHTHLSLYEGYNFSDENGTAARMIHNSSTSQPRSYTSSGTISYNSEGRTNETQGSEGYLVYVYDEAICYVGYNLTTREAIPTASYLLPTYSEDRSAAVSIEVTTPPAKTVYESGEWFDATGMVVTATYGDGSTAEVKGWGCSNVGELHSSDTEVQITYGNCEPVSIAISVSAEPSEEDLAGSGTKDDPYRIDTADDFATLTTLFNASTDSGNPYGTGKFFKQTSDIDMTGYAGYEGTHANGNAKCYFGGVYDGGGHTLTVNISSSGQTSVFPYLTGVILNLKIKGSISSDSSAQPIRTIQGGSVIANVVVDMTLTSSAANGVCYTQYGTMLNVYVTGIGTKAVYNTNSSGKYYHVFTNMKTSSGSALTHSTCTASSDLDAIAAAFNNREDSAFNSGIAALTAKCPDLGEAALGQVSVANGELILSGGEIGGNVASIAGSGTKDDPYLIDSPETFKLFTDFFNASSASSSPYGAGEYFLQTADINMTDFVGYEGTHANGNAKCYFGGIYDGGGHTLTVNISSEGQTSVFPYIYGAIINLRIAGSITSDTSAQPVRTVQSGAVVANCLFDLILTSGNANGVCYTNYGTVYNVYVTGVATHAAHSSNSGNYYNAYAYVKDSSGAVLTTSVATNSNDLRAVVNALSDKESADAASGLAALTTVNAALTADALEPVRVDKTKILFGEEVFLKGDVNANGTVTLNDVSYLLDILGGVVVSYNAGVADVDEDGILAVSDVTYLLDMLAGKYQ